MPTRRSLSICIALSLACSLASCGGTSAPTPEHSPSWSAPASTATRIVGVGLDATGTSESARVARATEAARGDVANQLSTRIRAEMSCTTTTDSTRQARGTEVSSAGTSHSVCVRNVDSQSEAAIENLRVIGRECSARECRVTVALEVAEAVRASRSVLRSETESVLQELSSAEATSARGEAVQAYARARRLSARASRLFDRWAFTRLLDDSIEPLAITETQFADRIGSIERAVRILVPTSHPDPDVAAFWRDLARALNASGQRDFLTTSSTGATYELSGTPSYGPDSAVSGAVVVRGTMDLVVRSLHDSNVADSSVRVLTNGSGPDRTSALASARVSLACRAARSLLEELLGEETGRMECEAWR